jgi:NAD-dependent deacetylase
MAVDYDAAARLLLGSGKVVVFTGAGMSKDSGVDTFRGPGGIWERFSAADLATYEGFIRDPAKVWRWNEHRRQQVAGLTPHQGYIALAEMEDLFPEVVVITQNIDGLHARSGASHVVELHGNIWKVRCSVEDNEPWLDERTEFPEVPLHCDSCGGLLRPHIVWFGETLDPNDVYAATEESSSCDSMLVVGTSAVVYPAAGFPQVAKREGAKIIEVNIEPTPITDYADASLFGRAEEVLPALVEALRSLEDRTGEGGRDVD